MFIAVAICTALAFAGHLLIKNITATATGSWGLSFRQEGYAPVAPASPRELARVDAAYLGDTTKKVIYLTFDAGYENGNVSRVLDVLKSEQVPGAFFILAHLLEANTDLVQRMVDEGHLVCNHTVKHRNMTHVTSKEEFETELRTLETLFYEKTGSVMPKYYRPPEGRFSESNLKMAREAGYCTIFWSFAYADWDNDRQMSPEAAKKIILDNIHNGAVLLLHPTSATNAAVLGDVIRECKEQGYRFGTLDELVAP
jgi:peptidoglycan-N-acetylmuramic acid deacetylase